MTARFQGLVDPATGQVLFNQGVSGVVPVDAIEFRGMLISPLGEVYSTPDSGQPRLFQDGIALEASTGLTLTSSGPINNISMGGLGVDANGAVVLVVDPPDVIHQGVGITNEGELSSLSAACFYIVSATIGDPSPIQTIVCFNVPPDIPTCGVVNSDDAFFFKTNGSNITSGAYSDSPSANCLRFDTDRTIEGTGIAPDADVTLDYSKEPLVDGPCHKSGESDPECLLKSVIGHPVSNRIYGPSSASVGDVANDVVVVEFPTPLGTIGSNWVVFVNSGSVTVTNEAIVGGALHLTLQNPIADTDSVELDHTSLVGGAVAADGRGCYEFQAEDVVNNVDTTAPTIPANFSGTAVWFDQIDLSWDPSTDAKSGMKEYVVYRDFVEIDRVPHPTTTYSDTGLAANTTYQYFVTAVDNKDNESNASTPINETTFEAAPVVVSAEVGNVADNIVVVTFDKEVVASNYVTGWSFTENGGSEPIASAAKTLATEVQFTLTTGGITEGTSVAYNYNATSGDYANNDGVPLASASGSVTNNVSDITFQLHAFGEDANGQIRGLVVGTGSLTFGRTTAAMVETAPDSLIKDSLVNGLRFEDARRGENLASGLITETITVVNGNDYQLTIAGGNGDTAVCSGAFTGTLTANGTNRISWNSGTPKTSGSTSLTITVTGTLTEMFLEDVTGDSDQNPGEYIPAGESDGTDYSYAGGVRYYAYEKGNTVGVTGIVTEAKGADLTTDWGALFEPAATNIIADSEDLNAASWNKNRITITSNAAVAPNGLTTAQNILSTASANTSRALSPKTLDSGASYTYSHYVKKDGIDWVYLNALSFDVEQGCYFDLTNGVIGTSTAISEGIRDAGNGWYRCWIEFSTTTDLLGLVGINIAEADGDSILTGGGLSLFAWGAQMELGSLPTSYIPTSGSTQNRSADDGVPSFGFSNWNQPAGTLVLDLVMESEEDQGIFNVANAEAGVLSYDSTNKFQTDDGTNQANVDPTLSSNLGDTIRLCVGYKTSGSLFIGYKNVTDAGSWVWDTDAASYDGGFTTDSVINMFYNLAAVSQVKDVYYYQTQQLKTWIEANF